jgi:hypothetical protein
MAISQGLPIGPGAAVKRAQPAVGGSLQAAMYLFPYGFSMRAFTHSFGLIGYLLRRNMPSSPSSGAMLLAIDRSYLYLFSVAIFQKPNELGRWKLGSYEASLSEGRILRTLTLRLEGMGRVQFEVSTALANRANIPVLELVIGLAQSGVDSARV